MSEPREQLPNESDSPPTVVVGDLPDDQRVGQKAGPRQKRGGRSRSAYSFPDDLERCFCRNSTRVPPASFPVARREGVAKPEMVELARTVTQVLFCDLLHEGPHLWPSGDEFSPS